MHSRFAAVLYLFSIVFFVTSCGEKQTYHAASTGPINLVSVFSDDKTYQELEEELNDSLIFGKIFPGLYYPPEIMFAHRHFNTENFNRFKTTRLILDVKNGTPKIEFTANKFAKPQAYIEVSGQNSLEVLELLKENQDSIISFYRNTDREFILQDYKKESKKDISPLNDLGISMIIPNDFSLAENKDGFVWYRKDYNNIVQNRDNKNALVTHASQDILNLLFYKIPYKKDRLNKQDFYFLKDSITQKYLKGNKEPIAQENSKIVITDHVQVEMNPMLSDFYDFEKVSETATQITYEAQGFWSMTLSQMGGPFTSKIILDKNNKELYIVDAILFAPLNQGVSKKRDYITTMESLYTTFKTNL